MAEPILEQYAASPFEAATPYLEAVEQQIAESAAKLAGARDMLDAMDEALALTPWSRDELRILESVEGQVARRVDRLRARLAKAASGVTSSGASLSVTELADVIGQSEHTTRQLLDAGLLPGARRKTPGVKNSPWIIPATAPAAYLALHNGKEN